MSLFRVAPLSRLTVLAAVLAAIAVTASPAMAGTANSGLETASRTNPLAGLPWGVYTGSGNNGVYPYYAKASGRSRSLLARIALHSQTLWFGDWDANGQATTIARQYIANSTRGNPNVLAQVAIFRMDPWETCSGAWSSADQASYRTWVNNFAAGIGSSRVALVLQPDLAFAMCNSSRAPLQMVRYAARRFSALPHTTVYLDGGVHYWPSFASAIPMLEQAGIGYVRGFALNTTEYDSTGGEIDYGARVTRALAAAGYGVKHFIIDTAENGAPFMNGQYHGNIENPRVCRSRTDRICATLGIPPTTDVANPRWGLSAADRSLAARYADAYLWVARPWLDNGAYPFDLTRALGLAASTPW